MKELIVEYKSALFFNSCHIDNLHCIRSILTTVSVGSLFSLIRESIIIPNI